MGAPTSEGPVAGIMVSDSGELRDAFQRCLSQDAAALAAAEKHLEIVSARPGFLPATIKFIAESGDAQLSQVASIYTKNFILREWTKPEDVSLIKEEDRGFFYNYILQLLLLTRTQKLINTQVAATAEKVADWDFPAAWPDLLEKAVPLLAENDFGSKYAAAELINHTLARYRRLSRDDDVLGELKFKVLPTVCAPLLAVYLNTLITVKDGADGAVADPELCCRVLHRLTACWVSLISVDLPEFVEDQMPQLVPAMLWLLAWRQPSLEGKEVNDGMAEGPMDELKAEVLSFFGLFAQKYLTELLLYIEQVSSTILELLCNHTGEARSYDTVICQGLKYLSNIGRRSLPKPIFVPQVLEVLTSRILLPFSRLREDDLNLLEDNPQEFLRSALDSGGDVFSRRGSVFELVKALATQHATLVQPALARYIEGALVASASAVTEAAAASAAGEQQANLLLNRDAALNLMMALLTRGETRQYGVTRIFPLVSVDDFFKAQVASGLVRPLIACPPAEAVQLLPALGSMKFLATFKNHLADAILGEALPLVVKRLSAPAPADALMAAHTLSQLLVARDFSKNDDTGVSVFASLRPPLKEFPSRALAGAAVPQLLNLIAREGPFRESEFPMKCLMTVLSAQSTAETAARIPQMLPVFRGVLEKQMVVSNNPSFAHYLFENLALMVTAGAGGDASHAWLLEIVGKLLQNAESRKHDFAPYALQLLGLLVDLSPAPSATQSEIFAHLLQPHEWTVAVSHVPALVRVYCAFLRGYSRYQPLVDPHVVSIVDRALYCVANRRITKPGLDLLEAVVAVVNPATLGPQMARVVGGLVQKLRTSPTRQLCRQISLIIAVFTVRLPGPSVLPKLLDGVEAGLQEQFLLTVFLPHCAGASTLYEKRVALLAAAKLLPAAAASPAAQAECAKTCATLLDLAPGKTEKPTEDLALNDFAAMEILGAEEFQGTFNLLTHAQPRLRRCETAAAGSPEAAAEAREFLSKSGLADPMLLASFENGKRMRGAGHPLLPSDFALLIASHCVQRSLRPRGTADEEERLTKTNG